MPRVRAPSRIGPWEHQRDPIAAHRWRVIDRFVNCALRARAVDAICMHCRWASSETQPRILRASGNSSTLACCRGCWCRLCWVLIPPLTHILSSRLAATLGWTGCGGATPHRAHGARSGRAASCGSPDGGCKAAGWCSGGRRYVRYVRYWTGTDVLHARPQSCPPGAG